MGKTLETVGAEKKRDMEEHVGNIGSPEETLETLEEANIGSQGESIEIMEEENIGKILANMGEHWKP